MVYGAECWKLDDRTCRMLNGVNAAMLTHITGKTRHEEASPATRTFDIVSWIRARRLRWLGDIARIPDKEQRMLKTAVKDMYNSPTPGDLCMDAPVKGDWKALEKMAADVESNTQGVYHFTP